MRLRRAGGRQVPANCSSALGIFLSASNQGKLIRRAALFSMKVVGPLTSGFVAPCHPEAAFGWGPPNDENDSDAETHKEKQRDCPEHDLPAPDLAIHAAASIHRAADSQLLDTTPLLVVSARSAPPEKRDRSHDLGPRALACEVRSAIIRSSGPGLFTLLP
jgi:hypothetical protein